MPGFAELSWKKLPGEWRWFALAWLLLGGALAVLLWAAYERDVLFASGQTLARGLALAYLLTALAVVAGVVGVHRRRVARAAAQRLLREHAAALEARWQAVLDATHLGIWDWDERSHTMYYSSTWKSMLGYAEADLGNTLREWVGRLHPEERDWVLASVRRYYRRHGEGVYESVHRMRRKDGSYQWVEVRGRALGRDARGRPLRFAGVQADVTARRMLEERLDRLSENVPGLLFQYRRDANGRDSFLYCNEKVRELYGFTPEQLRRSAAPLLKRVHPDDVEALLRSVEESARTLSVWQFAYRVVQPGRGERWLSGMASPQRADDGGVVWHGYLYDATEEHQLRERLDRLVENVPGLLYQMRMEPGVSRRFIYASKGSHAIYGLAPEQVCKDLNAVLKLVHPDDRDVGLDKLDVSASKLSEWVHEYRVTLPQRGERWLSARARPQQAAGNAVVWHGYVQDITDAKQQALKLEESERLLNHLMREMPIGLCMIDDAGRIYFRNRRFDEYFGCVPGVPASEHWWEDLFPDPGYRAEALAQWEEAKAEALAHGGEIPQREYRVSTRQGGQRTMVVGGVAFTGHVMVTFIDQTEQRAQSERLRQMAFVDGLTGIANRRQFDATLKAEWSRCQRAQQPLALLMIDIDLFKSFNDVYGHQKGDECLQAVASALRAELGRPHDLVARYGGEEFACVLPDCDLPGALHKAWALCRAVLALDIAHAGSTVADEVTVSIGVAAQVPDESAAPEQLVARADACLYRAKALGRNRVESDPA